jgi:hypothetical protein
LRATSFGRCTWGANPDKLRHLAKAPAPHESGRG